MTAFLVQMDRLRQRDGRAHNRVAMARSGGEKAKTSPEREHYGATVEEMYPVHLGRHNGIRSAYTRLRILYE